MASRETKLSSLSSRGVKAMKPALSYFKQFLHAIGSGLHDGTSDEASSYGYVVLSVAENKMSFEPLQKRLAGLGAVPEDASHYTNMRGVDRFRAAIAATMERTCLQGAKVDPDCLCVQAGCGAVISTLVTLLAEDGDAVVLPGPAYPAFDNDCSVLAGAHLEHAPMMVPGIWSPASAKAKESPGGGEGEDAGDWDAMLSVAALEAAARRAEAKGHPPRILLLAHPHNPLGLVTPPAQLIAAIRWARARGMHVISDEIYANSVHSPSGEGEGSGGETESKGEAGAGRFKSALQLLHDESGARAGAGATGSEETSAGSGVDGSSAALGPLGMDVHVVWGFSKDFALSGYRTGVLLTHNPELLRALDNVSYFGAVSNDTQHRLAACLEDAAFTDGYLEGCRRAVRGNCGALLGALREAGIPFVPPRAGLFAVIDLRDMLPLPQGGGGGDGGDGGEAGDGLLPACAYAGERQLQQRVFEECRIVLTPGEAMHAPVPGLFRACFAWMPAASVRAGVRRLEALKATIAREKAAGTWVEVDEGAEGKETKEGGAASGGGGGGAVPAK